MFSTNLRAYADTIRKMLLAAQIIADNIRELAKQGEELSQPELAKRMDVGSKTFWTMKEGSGNPQLDKLEKAARYFRKPIWQLLIPDGHKLPRDFDPFKAPVPAVEIGHVRIPVLEALLQAGNGAESVDFPVVLGHIDVSEAWARKRLGTKLDRIRALHVVGDSMSPNINAGDLAFVDTDCQHFDADGIYVIAWNGRLLIKRLVVDFAANRIEIRSDNPNTPPQHIPPAEIDRLTICARVKAWLSVKGF